MKENQEEKKMSKNEKLAELILIDKTKHFYKNSIFKSQLIGAMINFEFQKSIEVKNTITTLTAELEQANKQIEIFEKEYEVALNQIIMQGKELVKANYELREWYEYNLNQEDSFSKNEKLMQIEKTNTIKELIEFINSLNKK